jgi:hypothetical protein
MLCLQNIYVGRKHGWNGCLIGSTLIIKDEIYHQTKPKISSLEVEMKWVDSYWLWAGLFAFVSSDVKEWGLLDMEWSLLLPRAPLCGCVCLD